MNIFWATLAGIIRTPEDWARHRILNKYTRTSNYNIEGPMCANRYEMAEHDDHVLPALATLDGELITQYHATRTLRHLGAVKIDPI